MSGILSKEHGDSHLLTKHGKEILAFIINNIFSDRWIDELERDSKKFLTYNHMLETLCENPSNPEELKRLANLTNMSQLEKMLHFLAVKRYFLMSGSRPEGLRSSPVYTSRTIEDPDSDALVVLSKFTASNFKEENCSFVIDTEETHAGYTRLRFYQEKSNLLRVMDPDVDTFRMIRVKENGIPVYCYVASVGVVSDFIGQDVEFTIHGPAALVTDQIKSTKGHIAHSASQDIVPALPCKYWPLEAHEWAKRTRKGWPTKEQLLQIVKEGCHIVPIAHPKSDYGKAEWRFSFSKAEITLCQSFTASARKAYSLFKLLCKFYTDSLSTFSTYMLKTTMFWACEKSPKLFNGNDVPSIVIALFDQLILFLIKQNIPNYFIKDNNMIDCISRYHLLTILKKVSNIRYHVLDALIECISTQRLDILPIVHDLHKIFEPCLKSFSDFRGSWKKRDEHFAESVKKLSAAYFIEGRDTMAIRVIAKFFEYSLEPWSLDAAKLSQTFAINEAKPFTLAEYHVKKMEQLKRFFDERGSTNLSVLWKLAHYWHVVLNEMVTDSRNNQEQLETDDTKMLKEAKINKMKQTINTYFATALRNLEEETTTTAGHKYLILLHQVLYLFQNEPQSSLQPVLQQLSSTMTQIDLGESVYLYQISASTLPDMLRKLVEVSDVIVIPVHYLVLYFRFLFEMAQDQKEKAEECCHELEVACSDPREAIDSRYYLLACTYCELGDMLQACKFLLKDLNAEYLRHSLNEFKDNAFVYKLCIFGFWVTSHGIHFQLHQNKQ